MKAVESDSVKSARKAKGKLHEACERVSEIRKRTLHGRNKMRMASMKESRDSLVTTQVKSHVLMRRGFGTSVPFIYIFIVSVVNALHIQFLFLVTLIQMLTVKFSQSKMCVCCDQ